MDTYEIDPFGYDQNDVSKRQPDRRRDWTEDIAMAVLVVGLIVCVTFGALLLGRWL